MTTTALQGLLDDADTQGAATAAVEPRALAGLARRALSLGYPLLACEWLQAAAALCERDADLRYLLALSEVRIGGYRDAQRWLKPLLDASLRSADLSIPLRVDVLALAGRIAKDCWQRTADAPRRDQYLADAITRYQHAWQESRDPFPGINAASLLCLRGDAAEANTLARAVLARIEQAPDQMDAHWREATIGEAMLLLGNDQAAAAHYQAAVAAAGSRLGDVASMRRQLRLLATALPQAAELHRMLRLPAVLAFTGHMLDAAQAQHTRFPAALEAAVATAIARQLTICNAGVGFCSAACGGDLLFIEAMLARGAEVNVMLPFAREDFIATSVATAGAAWVQRFETALRQVSRVDIAVPERYLGDDALFGHAGNLISGAARLRARDFDDAPRMLAVIDAEGGGGPGGALDTVSAWQASGLALDRIDLALLRGSRALPVSSPVEGHQTASGHASTACGLRREVRAMLFADVVGYSRLAEEHTPAYLLGFLGRVAQLVEASVAAPELVNTWGDGLFMVFADVGEAAGFALQLRDLVASTDWSAAGLPGDLQLRIGMHVGPVYPAEDPLQHRPNVFGTQVTRAARIEPVAAADSVFISAEAAYALAASGRDDVCADYLGSLPLAKAYGSQPLYRLRRSSEVE